MKVYVLLSIKAVGDHWRNEKVEVEVLEAIFATREAAENEAERALRSDNKNTGVIIKEYEVKQ